MPAPASSSRRVNPRNTGRESASTTNAALAKRIPTKNSGPVSSRAQRMIRKVAPQIMVMNRRADSSTFKRRGARFCFMSFSVLLS